MDPAAGLYIDGDIVSSIDGASLPSINPATGEQLADISEAGPADVDRAVLSSRTAAKQWARLSAADRGAYLSAIAAELDRRCRELALVDTLDTGMPLSVTRDIFLPLARDHWRYYADQATYSALLTSDRPRPRGVTAQILPSTAPLLVLARQVAPALALGCTAVVKPAAPSSLAVLAFAEVLTSVGLPPGVITIITGDSETGLLLARQPDVDAVGFTGPARIASQLQRTVAGTRKSVIATLQGVSAAVVGAHTDPAIAADAIVRGLLRPQDPSGANGVHVYAHLDVLNALEDALRARLECVVVGDPLESSTERGPIPTRERWTELRDMIAQDPDGTWQVPMAAPEGGWWQAPGIARGVVDREFLGPLVGLTSFETDAELARLLHRPGLRVGVWPPHDTETIAAMSRADVAWAGALHQLDPAAVGGQQGGRQAMRYYQRTEVS